jgi:hypothetical protein
VGYICRRDGLAAERERLPRPERVPPNKSSLIC